jgi:hypothetical protein
VVVMPHVRHRKRDKFCEGSRAVDPNSFGVRTKMTPTCQTISATAADNMPFSADDVAGEKIGYVLSYFYNFPYELMTHDQGDWNGFLSPVVPFENVEVRAANAGFFNPNEHIIDTESGFWNVFQPQSFFGVSFDEGFHKIFLVG